MASHINPVAVFLLLSSSVLLISHGVAGKDAEYAESVGFDESHPKAENTESHQNKRKWGSDRMGLWGKRFQMNDAESAIPEAEKRKWTSGKMGMWGKRSLADWQKRKWDSRNMAMWGRKRSLPIATAPAGDGDYYDYYDGNDNDVIYTDKRRWGPDGMWGKRLDSAINQIRSQKSKWASGSMGMWGKRSYVGPDDTAEME